MLHGIEDGDPPRLGRKVVVYGGGDTALDAARTARRLTGVEPVVVYRRTRERMPAHPDELQQAEQEGISFRWLSTVAAASAAPPAPGEVHGGARLRIEQMELDDDGMPQPTGEFEELDADSLILALGQSADLRLLEGLEGIRIEDGVVEVDQRMMTGREGVFAGGDMTPGQRMAAVAIGHGRRAARCIDSWLSQLAAPEDPETDLVGFDQLNTWYYADAPRTVRPLLEDIRRQSSFEEVVDRP